MEAAGQHRGLLEALLDRQPEAVWVVDLDGTTAYANAAFERSWDPALNGEARRHLAADLDRLMTGSAEDRDVEVELCRPDGVPTTALVRQSLLRRAGAPLLVVRRIASPEEQRQALELRECRHFLQQARELARLGSWVHDLESDQITALDGVDRLTGPGRVIPAVDLRARMHPEDAARLRGTPGTPPLQPGPFSADLRLADDHGADGDGWRHLRVRGEVHTDVSGTPTHVTGTQQDVTDVRIAEAALRDEIVQGVLMRRVAAAANAARTLTEVLAIVRPMLAGHDDWVRSTAFRVDESGAMTSLDGHATPEEEALCARALETQAPAWSADHCTVAFGVSSGPRSYAVGTITASEPVQRRDLVEVMAESVAVQLARVAEREETGHALAAARDAAMAASRQKSDFLATMSHEIRTPLNGIIGLTDLLRHTALDAEQQSLAEGVHAASHTLLAVLGDILDFSKLDGRRVELEDVDVDLRALLERVVRASAGAAHANSVDVAVTCGADVPESVRTDPTRLTQVLMNLVSNAVKFSAGGQVDVRVSTPTAPTAPSAPSAPGSGGRQRLLFEVLDTGIGIEPDQLERLFEPFTQADASTTRRFGGTGLGLSIAREIVAALGGAIAYAPRPGGGSVFSFAMDCEVSGPLSPDRTSERDVRTSPDTSAPRVAGAAPLVLVVDDHTVNQVVAAGLLASLGCRAVLADDGHQALELLEHEHVDAVLMDIQMPVLDGYATTRSLREQERQGTRVPVIAMTAAAVVGERERCLAAGMDEFLTKPVDRGALAEVLDRLIVERKDPMPDHPEPLSEGEAGFLAPTGPMDGLDTERLDMLRDLDPGETTYIDRAIGNFSANSRAAEASILELVEAGDAVALRSVAHKIAGSALNLGVNRAGEAARALEQLADTGTTEGAGDLLGELRDAMEEARARLAAYQATYTTDEGTATT